MMRIRAIQTMGLTLLTTLLLSACEVGEDHEEGEEGATRQNIMMQRTDSLPFSNGVMVDGTLYLAGTLGLDPATGQPPAAIEDEVRNIMENFRAVLTNAGMTMDDLVSVTVYCPDTALYGQFNAVYRTYFTNAFPARAFIGSGPLLLGAHFEVQGIAVRPETESDEY